MLIEQDRMFLTDYMAFGCMNHWISIAALREALKNPHAIPSKTWRTNKVSARFQDVRSRSMPAARYKRTLLLKVFAEYVAAVEDYSAFFLALGKHSPEHGGILHFFSESDREVYEFVDRVAETSSNSATKVLGLPDLRRVRRAVSGHEYEDVKIAYRTLLADFRRLTKTYLRSSIDPANIPSELPNRNTEVVLLRYAPSWRKVKRPIDTDRVRLLSQVYNKLKHRFLVPGSAVSVLGSVPDDDDLLYAMLGRRTLSPALLAELTLDMAKSIKLACGIMLFLDELRN